MHFKMLSAICFNLGQSKILSSGNGLNENGVELYKLVENTPEKRVIACYNFSFSRSIFKRLVLQTLRKNKGLFEKVLMFSNFSKVNS